MLLPPSWRFTWGTPLCHVGDRSLVTSSAEPSPSGHRLFLPPPSQGSLPHYSAPFHHNVRLHLKLSCSLHECSPPLEYTVHTVQSLSHVQLLVTPWTAAHQASLSITNSWSLLKLISIESVKPYNHLILSCPLLLPPSMFPKSRSFPVSQFFTSCGQSMELQLQHQSFQGIFRTDFR